jgi:hypothetical protein
MDQLTSQILIPIIVLALIVIIVLLGISVSLYKQNKMLRTPRFGFLGKPLYVIALVIMLGGIFVVTKNIDLSGFNTINADREVTSDIQVSVISTTDSTAVVKFNLVPRVGQLEWGNAGDEFQVYWTINGVENEAYIENIISKSNPGGFSKELRRGKYEIKTVVVFQGKSYTTSKSLSF